MKIKYLWFLMVSKIKTKINSKKNKGPKRYIY